MSLDKFSHIPDLKNLPKRNDLLFILETANITFNQDPNKPQQKALDVQAYVVGIHQGLLLYATQPSNQDDDNLVKGSNLLMVSPDTISEYAPVSL
ncbi:hypothetical protein GOV14_07155 [Candidatus Pacearchaeota archaeon]|nr:hypothetical protein [Candidatus Pacearchaeota archaeon]